MQCFVNLGGLIRMMLPSMNSMFQIHFLRLRCIKKCIDVDKNKLLSIAISYNNSNYSQRPDRENIGRSIIITP